jgi:hypothetical protein
MHFKNNEQQQNEPKKLLQKKKNLYQQKITTKTITPIPRIFSTPFSFACMIQKKHGKGLAQKFVFQLQIVARMIGEE